jgi:3-oxoacyl-[acyl-carrier-protein] synthase II
LSSSRLSPKKRTQFMLNNLHPLPAERRVVVTGAGLITSMGNGWRANADGFRAGRVALKDITLFDTSRQRVGRGGEVDLPAHLPENSLPARRTSRIDRASALMLHSFAEAWNQAGGLEWSEREKVSSPFIIGTSAGAMSLGEAYYQQAALHLGQHRGQTSRVHHYQVQMQALLVQEAYGLRGPISIITNACASGANAIGDAYMKIRLGQSQTAIALGYDALCQLVFAGFDSLQALSTDVPRPFDAARDGLAIGEGAATVVLESLARAQARGATILAEVIGYGSATDGHHLTQPHPQGDAALRSMTAATEQAGLTPRDVRYINSHGTGTPLNDVAEAHAISRWAGSDAEKVSVSSTKSCIGHLLGGAGAVEAVICLMAMRENFLPPTANVRTIDPAVRFDLVQSPREAEVPIALTNSFGFGGANATLIFRRDILT